MRQAIERAAGKFGERKVQLGDTYFKINKLLPLDAFKLLEEMRAMIGRSLPIVGAVPHGSDPAVYIASVLLALTPADMETVRRKLFSEVRFRNRMQKSWGVLEDEGKEGMAFSGLGPIQIYEMIARAFAVNFMQSWDDFVSLMDLLFPEVSDQLSRPTSQE